MLCVCACVNADVRRTPLRLALVDILQAMQHIQHDTYGSLFVGNKTERGALVLPLLNLAAAQKLAYTCMNDTEIDADKEFLLAPCSLP